MNNFTNPFNLVLWFVVITFWATAILLSRVNQRSVSPRLLLVPAFFLMIGMGINLYLMPWGTYMVAIIHVLMMPALLKIAKTKP
jgi:hypothetical protein